jgi:hypothetical protein
VAVGKWSEDGNHHFIKVPDAVAFIPFTVILFIGCSKPTHANVLLRPFVNDLIGLDPQFRADRESWADASKWTKVRETLFTVRLFVMLGDTPARGMLKACVSHHSTSDGGCECCTAVGVKFGVTGTSRFLTSEVWSGVEIRTDEKFTSYKNHFQTRSVSSQTSSYR